MLYRVTKLRVTRLLVIMAFIGSSSMVFAGGEGCNSKKGAHKELSAEALQNMEKGHTWHKFDDSSQTDQANKPRKQDSNKNVSGSDLIES